MFAGVLLLTLLAAALRLFQLNNVPPGLFLDEAGNGLDAHDILRSGQRRAPVSCQHCAA
jgi:hypothetical protein